ncbi:hypothetical protein LJR251_001510 [Rhizobium rhizogenes]|uniref:hypothetical protein n=1 Tax=Rhizobium rhizogenes TaxID=359 RepID=UPI000645CEB9|nr:hypothetical protein [Rhizobium rhizogenes]
MQKIAAAALLAVFLPLSLSAVPAAAADVTTPVKEVMDATVSNWAGGDSDWQDIFDESKLDERYSKDLIAKYKAAAQFPAADEDGISPFDYDVIVGGQDACPLQDLNIAAQAPKSETTEVVATFKTLACQGSDANSQAVTTVRFEVIQEAGKPVIDDIITVDEGGQSNSLKSVMQDIVKQQQSADQQQKQPDQK